MEKVLFPSFILALIYIWKFVVVGQLEGAVSIAYPFVRDDTVDGWVRVSYCTCIIAVCLWICMGCCTGVIVQLTSDLIYMFRFVVVGMTE